MLKTGGRMVSIRLVVHEAQRITVNFVVTTRAYHQRFGGFGDTFDKIRVAARANICTRQSGNDIWCESVRVQLAVGFPIGFIFDTLHEIPSKQQSLVVVRICSMAMVMCASVHNVQSRKEVHQHGEVAHFFEHALCFLQIGLSFGSTLHTVKPIR